MKNQLFPRMMAIILAFYALPAFTQSNFNQQIKDDPSARIEYETRMLVDPVTNKIPENIRLKELAFTNLVQSSRRRGANNNFRTSTPFTRSGPRNVGGRTRALALDKTNENIILAGGVSGGMWRSTDQGLTWTKTTLPSQLHSVSCLVQDPRAGFTNIWYYGTGELFGNSASGGGAPYQGNGIYKSIDGGVSWSVLSVTEADPTRFIAPPTNVVGTAAVGQDFSYVWNIAVNPTNGDVYAATYSGIMRSTDGGVSWTRVLVPDANTPAIVTATDIAISSTGIIYATIGQFNATIPSNRGFYTSTNGINWTNLTAGALRSFATPPSTYERTVIDISPSNPNLVFFFLTMVGGTGNTNDFGLLRYDASGAGTWQNLSANLPAYGDPVGNMSQNIYNQIVKIKPDDPNFVMVGTINLNRSTNGFASRPTSLSDWIGGYGTANNFTKYPNHHPDNHALVFLPSDPKKVISAHDGGLSITDDITASPVVWRQLNNGYFTTQAYTVAIDEDAIGDTRLMAGFQDNGKWTTFDLKNVNTPWLEEVGGGDGAYVAFGPGNIRYISDQRGRIIRVEGPNISNPTTGFVITNPSNNNLFINPFVLNPSNLNTMYQPSNGSIRYNNDLATTTTPNSANWVTLSNTTSNTFITAIGVSKAPVADVVYYGRAGRVFRLNNAPTNPTPIDVTPTLSGYMFPNGSYVSCIAVDETNHLNVIVVYSNYSIRSIWHSTDGGTSWTDISGNLEQNPDGTGNGPSVRWAEFITYSEEGKTGYFVGTSTGLYYTETLDGTSTQWVLQSPDLIGNTVVTMVKVRNSDGLVAVATHGGGLFSASFQDSGLPGAPRNLALRETSVQRSTFSWENTSTKKTRFEILRKPSDDPNEFVTFPAIATTPGNETTLTIDNDLVNKKDYSFVVRPIENPTGISNEAIVPRQPEELAVESFTPEGPILKWKDLSKKEISYEIQRSQNPSEGFITIGSVEADKNSYADRSTVRGQIYYYRVRALAPNGFSAYSETLKADLLTPISNQKLLNQSITVFPNPAQQYFTVNLKSSLSTQIKVELFSETGVLLDSKFMTINSKGEWQANFDASYLPTGKYIVKVYSKEGVENRLVVVQ